MTGFLKCDAQGCDHVEHHPTITEDMIDKPCPKCGASLLTTEDYRMFRRVMPLIRLFKFFGLVKDYKPDEPVPDGYETMSFHGHDGTLTITSKDAGETT